MDIFWLILIGMTAGWLAGYFMTGKGFGAIGDLIAGVMGALIGGALFEKTGIFAGSGLIGRLLVATIGAIVFLYGVRMVKKV
ncbi:MAG: GlsB/YeaQ/YmgE family stress response membrane protein [Planctomycetota bacterium]|jgi:uncharacterized membrane protein YeaQ/YmgE (transglycosylase-associated protein family)